MHRMSWVLPGEGETIPMPSDQDVSLPTQQCLEGKRYLGVDDRVGRYTTQTLIIHFCLAVVNDR